MKRTRENTPQEIIAEQPQEIAVMQQLLNQPPSAAKGGVDMRRVALLLALLCLLGWLGR